METSVIEANQMNQSKSIPGLLKLKFLLLYFSLNNGHLEADIVIGLPSQQYQSRGAMTLDFSKLQGWTLYLQASEKHSTVKTWLFCNIFFFFSRR